MHLASTFGLPVLLPSFPHLVDGYGDQTWVHFYDADGGAEALADALTAFRASDSERRAARAHARAYTPWDMANRFLDLYRRLRPRTGAVTASS
jgi:beta-1,4-mannosyltransferase